MMLLVGAVQFVNVLDFMMVMPLGPDFAKALDIPTSQLGLIGGSYTAAAAIAGIIGSKFLDRFDRRSALAVAMLGLVLGTIGGGFAVGLGSLMLMRVLAGAFGGPATAIALSIVADVVPPERRGRAIGTVMAAFSVASVLGVPAGLELARLGGWQMPFFCVGGLGLILAALAIWLMPPMKKHLENAGQQPETSTLELVSRAPVLLSLIGTLTVMISIFIIVPNLSAYLQFNAGYPRERLGLLYLVGGIFNFVVTRMAGGLVDRFGAPLVAGVGTVVFAVVLGIGFVPPLPLIPVMAVFVSFMVAGALRGVAYNTLSSKVPAPHERARFMSTQSAVQHIASALGAVLGSAVLREMPDHKLANMPAVAMISIVLGSALPFLMAAVASQLKRRVVPAAPLVPE